MNLATHPGPGTGDPRAIAAAHVRATTAACAAALRPAAGADWSAAASGLDWSCSDTAAHIVDDMYGYATQIAGNRTGRSYIAFELTPQGAPEPVEMIEAIEASGALLAAAVATAAPEYRAGHVFGESGPIGFAAMGVTELAVHTRDIAVALDTAFTPPEDAVAHTLGRLFPNAPEDTAPWDALLWCTGRTVLPGRPRLAEWRWFGEGP